MNSKTINREYSRFYRLAFPEKVREIERRYKRSSKGRLVNRQCDKRRNGTIKRMNSRRKNNALRNAVKRQAFIGDLPAISKIYSRCAELRQWFDVSVDHIIPLAKGGAHSPENLQIIYRKENILKNASLTFVPSIIFS